ncbi:hypothetical protein CPB83DRAFT_898156 [Crepidotus variabilis]|uniref:Uncharacterized protein n=1 Tax=Crepidotus variabilis TaxID=179855 RepID=A0A9P6E7U3_9AGAR|nr:hypothetical protein CPB83DRAFT_898156 [Crepidotus variabilis]
MTYSHSNIIRYRAYGFRAVSARLYPALVREPARALVDTIFNRNRELCLVDHLLSGKSKVHHVLVRVQDLAGKIHLFCIFFRNSTLLDTNNLIEAMVPGRTWTGDILAVRAAAKNNVDGVVHLCSNDDILIDFAVRSLVERMTRGLRLCIPVYPVFCM